MSGEEFIKIAKSCGYATLPVIRQYVKEQGEREYTDDDLVKVYRRDVDRYYLAHKPSENNKTTKKYTVYNSQRTGGSY